MKPDLKDAIRYLRPIGLSFETHFPKDDELSPILSEDRLPNSIGWKLSVTSQ